MADDGRSGGGEGGDDDFIFNEYAIDDSLNALQRLVNYHGSDFSLQRLVLIRELADTAAFAGYHDTQAQIIPLLSNFVADTEPAVRHAFASQLAPLAEYMLKAGEEAGYQELLNALMPHAVELLVDKNVEVSAVALQAFVKLSSLVRPEHVERQVLQVITTLAHSDSTEDYRMVAAQLFDELCGKLGPALVESVVVPELSHLANDASFSVRRTVGSSFGGLCKMLSPEKLVALVLPTYLSLCRDEVWGVRKACAEAIVKVSQGVTDEARVSSLIPAFKSLSEDPMRWVRVAAYQNLGQLIHTMRSSDVNSMFLKIFTDMAFQSEGGDSDFAEYCAFSFPAVVAVMGPSRWRELDDAFATLLKDVQWKVRKTLAYSLHEIAKLIGAELSEKSLTVALELFLRDLDEVKTGVLMNVDQFMAVLSPAQREKYAPLICAVPVESENWRLRNLVAAKLGLIARLLPAKAVNDNICELVLRLLDDSVTDVRTSCYCSVGIILQHMEESPSKEYYVQFSRNVFALVNRPNYQSRQMFLYILQQVMELDAVPVVEQMLEKATALADDKVANVRFVLARVMAHSGNSHPRWKSHPKVVALVRKLSEDKDKEIAALATQQLPRPVDLATAASYRTA